jgi:hypothetical protein
LDHTAEGVFLGGLRALARIEEGQANRVMPWEDRSEVIHIDSARPAISGLQQQVARATVSNEMEDVAVTETFFELRKGWAVEALDLDSGTKWRECMRDCMKLPLDVEPLLVLPVGGEDQDTDRNWGFDGARLASHRERANDWRFDVEGQERLAAVIVQGLPRQTFEIWRALQPEPEPQATARLRMRQTGLPKDFHLVLEDRAEKLTTVLLRGTCFKMDVASAATLPRDAPCRPTGRQPKLDISLPGSCGRFEHLRVKCGSRLVDQQVEIRVLRTVPPVPVD